MRQKRPYELALLYTYSEIYISVRDIIKRFTSMKKLIYIMVQVTSLYKYFFLMYLIKYNKIIISIDYIFYYIFRCYKNTS